MDNVTLDKKLLETALRYDGVDEMRCKKVLYLLNIGADVNVCDEYGTPLIVRLMANEKYNCVAKILLDRGVNVNKTDNTWRTALMTACKYGSVDMIECLLNKNADLEYVDRQNWTALFYASYYGRDDVVKLLIKKGAVVNHKAYREIAITPLMASCVGWKCNNNYKETIKVLIENGADMMIRNKDGENVLDFAKNSRNDELLAFLKEEKNKLEGTWNLTNLWRKFGR